MTPKKIDWDAINALYGAWADRDDIDDEWLARLRGSWDASYEAIMQDEQRSQVGITKEQYEKFVEWLDYLIDNGAIEGSPLAPVLYVIGDLVEAYETKHGPLVLDKSSEQDDIEAFNRFIKSL